MPTLARLSFFLPPAQVDDLVALYDRILTPLIQSHGLESGFSDDRPYMAGVFSQLFAVDNPTALIHLQQALRLDPAWQSALKTLGERLGVAIRHELSIYATSGTEEQVVKAGPGQRQGPWHTLSVADGLGSALISVLLWDPSGKLWIGTWEGLSCFDGAAFTNYTPAHGLAGPRVRSLLMDRQGRLWVGTFGGVNCWDGQNFTKLTLDTSTDQWRNAALVIHEDGQGRLWFINFRGDILCYDGQEVTTLHRSEGRHSYKHLGRSLVEDRQGRLWFATGDPGVWCYSEGQWRLFTQADGLVEDDVRAIGQDRQGQLWFATAHGGVSRYDGQAFVTVTTGEGLGHAPGWVILEDRQGRLWFATDGGGVSRWDGEGFTQFTTAQGLAYDRVFAMMEDEQGHLWFGTQGGGVSLYDGQVFQTLSSQDGLVNDSVQEIIRTRQGHTWITTAGGITRYQPASLAPGVRLKQIVADRTYAPAAQGTPSYGQGLIRFEFQGRSFTSRPDRLVYRYRLEGHDPDWKTTREHRAEYLNLPLGMYTFQVQAVDADLNYSEPASVRLEVAPDPKMEAFKEEASRLWAKGQFVGDSPAVKAVMEELRDVAVSDLTVLILGETGTGKGLAAQYVHHKSPRQSGPFITVNCGAIAQGLEESSLFGHEKGAFTGAVYQKIGWVGMAQGGTLFLDEVGELPPLVQVKLLRLLQDHEYERLGGSEVLVSNARIIAATNRDLEAMVREGTFRTDLYFRLNAYPVRLPPLRERKEDIPQLAEYFMAPVAAHLGKKIQPPSPKVLKLLDAYYWPGNVRELQHVVGRAVTACQGAEIQPAHIALEGKGGPHSQNGNGRVYLIEEMERRHIQGVLEEVGWKVEGAHGAAALLGLHPSTLRSRMQKLGIRKG